ncbi:cell wall-associated NlpC family hydrolase [Aminobacter niigataensis]|uniref:Cell wall-associated NlpC family hydrolase n=1 Tax=Aminobacter niigataensis TaxID=83265 RepID=A0ABR6L888_9HYPH|nr:NlpC/P60 family protein [Aminobacter niigataensis]MBB4653022.1 cell wall-associated NlpC family hydrolase [Aminobacter niigataensis]
MNLDDFVGLPWLDRGRDRNGCDCWGLLALVYAERFGIELPSFRDDYQTAADGDAVSALIDGRRDCWTEIPDGTERPGDAVLMSLGGRPRHVGIVIGGARVLHIERGAGSVIESYRSFRLRRRVLGFFRHDGVAAS